MEICKKESCTGCHACYTICPKNCIKMVENEEGFLYPLVDKNLCIECGLCKKTCPVNKPVGFNKNRVTFAAWSLDDAEHRTSSSGGIASAFSREVIKEGGCVFGAAFEENLKLQCTKVEDKAGIERLKGSKYIQSVVGDSFKNLIEELEAGREVLFISTPCQVAGLKKVLKKSYENLITVDLICHGTPSKKVLDKYLEDQKKKFNKSIDRITFRGEEGFLINLYSNKEKVYSQISVKDLYYVGFLRGLYYRKSCYECTYAKSERISDITIGDFWGLGKEESFEYDVKNGVSCCLVNTEKGERFIKRNASACHFVERDFQEAVQGNKQLRFPSKMHKNRDKFFLHLNKGKSFKSAVWHTVGKEIVAYRILDIIHNLKK